MKTLALEKQFYEGNIQFRIKYGFPGIKDYVIEKDLIATFMFDPSKSTLVIASLVDRPV